MIALLVIAGLIVSIIFITTFLVRLSQLISGYKYFQRKDEESSIDYAIIDYSTLKRLYQVNPEAYTLTSYGQLYRLRNSHGWTVREVRICFKTIVDYCQFIHDKNNKEKTDATIKKNQKEVNGLNKLRDLTQEDIDNLRAKLDKEFQQEQEKNEKIKKNLRQIVTPAELRPFILPNGNIGCYNGQPCYVDSSGTIYQKDKYGFWSSTNNE